MIKLYKKDGDRLLYWETWEDGGKHTMHWGVVGDEGETQALRSGMFRKADKAVAEEMARHRQEGYAEIDDEDLQSVVVQYRTETWGDLDDLDKRHGLEELLNDHLGWTGLGRCDGGSIGSGTMEVCCLVVDARIGAPVMVRILEEAGLLEGAVIARELEDGFEVLHPSDFEGDFSSV